MEIPIAYRERSGRSKLSVVRDGTRFLQTILWTSLEYNPVRLMELAGLAAFGVAGLIGLALVVARLQGITDLGPWGVFGVYAALVLAVGGVSLFSLGTTFNCLVALFHRRPIRQAQLVTLLLGRWPERHFGWIGLGLGAGGAVLGLISWSSG